MSNASSTPNPAAAPGAQPAAQAPAGKPEGAQRAQFEQLRPEAQGGGDVNLDVILDVSVTLSMEVGRTRIPIRNLLQLNQGSVVELERGAGEPLDIYVNGTLIAHGEVVVVNEKFGVRLTDIISPAERIRQLK
jgi:flagellar motor switch protein FliN